MSIIIGCGHLGREVAKLEEKPLCITRSDTSCSNLEKQGFDARAIDLSNRETLTEKAPLFNQQWVYYFVPPPAIGTRDTIIQSFLQTLQNNKQSSLIKKILLVSTTGVYGDCQGKWIDEQQALNPQADRAKRRVDAEQQLASFANTCGIDYTILRVPGIYGPQKLPLQRIKAAKPVLALSESPWSNRIHIKDLAQICYLAMHKKLALPVYNVSDNEPTSMSDYFIQLARHFNLPEPPQISLDEARKVFSENMISYLVESKRIDNRKLLEELGYQLKYPSLKDGLQAIKT